MRVIGLWWVRFCLCLIVLKCWLRRNRCMVYWMLFGLLLIKLMLVCVVRIFVLFKLIGNVLRLVLFWLM